MGGDTTFGGPPVIPGLRYEALLGSGGFAEVYRYEQVELGRSVAVKVLFGLESGEADHFRAETHVMARLSSHPSIVPIYQVGQADDGRPYLVMQLCPPPHLADRIRSGGMPVPTVLEAGVQLAGAVETAHRLGILHRDIKPANILFSEFGRPMLADFGIASSSAIETPLHAFSPTWAPPEQIAHGAATPACDIYSLSATLWAMLTGHAPDSAADPDSTRRLTGRDDVPRPLQDALITGLARDPADRYPSALALGRTLQQVQQHLGLPVTPIELWDGDGRDAAPAEREATEPGGGDRTLLIPLAARDDAAPNPGSAPVAVGVPGPGPGVWQVPGAAAPHPPGGEVSPHGSAAAWIPAERTKGSGASAVVVALVLLAAVALVAGTWFMLNRREDPPPSPGSTSTSTTVPTPSSSEAPTRTPPPATAPPAPAPATPPRATESQTPGGGSSSATDDPGLGGGGWG